jgi:hypothetical protein
MKNSMVSRALFIWVAGLVTAVPFGTYYLFVHAERDQYALLIILLLFWVFGYWGVVGPILTAVKVRSVFKSLEQAHAQGRLKDLLQSEETRNLAVDLIASENRIPRFLANKVYLLLVEKLRAADSPTGGPTKTRDAGPRQ